MKYVNLVEEALNEAKARGELQQAIMKILDGMKSGDTFDVSSNKELMDKYGISKLMNAGADLGKKGLVDWDGSNIITVK